METAAPVSTTEVPADLCGSPAGRLDWRIWAAALTLAVLPRLIRMYWPLIWIEGSAPLYHGLAMQLGQAPFRDTLNPHLPWFESGLSLIFRLGLPAHRAAEILNNAVLAGSSLLLFDLARRRLPAAAALLTVGIFSTAPLLFRYHVCERVNFTLALGCAALWLLTVRPNWRWSLLLAGGLAGLAAAIKISGLFWGALLLPALWRRRDRAAEGVIGFLLVAGGIYSYYFLRYGSEVFIQVFLLHFAKGQGHSVWIKFSQILIPSLAQLLPLGAGGLILACRREAETPWRESGLVALLFFGFYIFHSSTMFFHSAIDLLPALALGAGYAGAVLGRGLGGRSEERRAGLVVLSTAAAFGVLGAVTPATVTHGWDGVPRRELDQAAAFLRAHTDAGRPIAAPHYLAAEAGRRKLVDYREMIGPYLWVEETWRSQGWGILGAARQFRDWDRMILANLDRWQPLVIGAVENRQVGAVVWDDRVPEWALATQIDRQLEASQKFLSRAGYQIAYRQGPYTIWLPVD